ncbi:serine O-acetyltransferase [bacterium]|nr:serine O-acetyltransferase [bacterium]
MKTSDDPIWVKLYERVSKEAEQEPILASYLYSIVLNHSSLEDALSFLLAGKLASASLQPMQVREMIEEVFCASDSIGQEFRADLQAICDRDPAADNNFAEPFLHYKGFHALESYRIAHWLWNHGRKGVACHLQNRISELFGVDIHPAAKIGKGILIDHATSVVIGETAVVEDDVSMLHEVTLGGTGNVIGDRHPKIRRGVLIGAGAKILGNVEVGEYSKIAAGSVVLMDIPPNSTAAGVPAKVIGRPLADIPAYAMNQMLVKPKGYRKK